MRIKKKLISIHGRQNFDQGPTYNSFSVNLPYFKCCYQPINQPQNPTTTVLTNQPINLERNKNYLIFTELFQSIPIIQKTFKLQYAHFINRETISKQSKKASSVKD